MHAERSDSSLLPRREALHRITEAVLSLTQQDRVLLVLSARAHSVVCEPVRSASLSRESIDRRPCERPHDNSNGETSDPGRSGAPGPLLTSDAQASVYLGKPCRLPIAGRAQRQTLARGGSRILSRGDSWPAPRAFASSQAKNHQTDRTPPRGERRSPQHRCHPRSTSTRKVEGGRS